MKTISLLLAGLIFSLSIYSQNSIKIGKLYNQREYEKVIELGLKELKSFPSHPLLNMWVGRAYTDIKQFEKAIPFLKKGTVINNNLDWVQAWSYGYLGICYYVTDEYKKSKESIVACIKLNATENASKFAQNRLESWQMTSFYDDWEIIESENIRFHFQESKNIPDKELYMKDREKAYVEINRFFNAKPYKKIDFFVWDDPKQAKRVLGQELGFANSTLCVINSRNNQTLGHEIAHILVAFGIHPIIITRLISEGIATYFDQTNRDRMKRARKSLAGKDVKIIVLWENPISYPEEFNYTVGAALIAFLFEKGTDEQMKSLLKDQTVTSARNIYQNFDSLIKEFTIKLEQ
ncbi:MAG TPA: hypothetical protein PLJ84_03325 [Bacteroidales bacterium]|nr:hypothetical protein [Bacteroidales bacterium]